MTRRSFPRDVLAGPTLDAARALLGASLVRTEVAGPRAGRRAGRIVEVEAYIGQDDQASHARFGRTARNAVMFGPPGLAYVYLVYGMHECLNVVTEPEGRPAAVLIRAVEPVEGEAAMRAARLAWAERRARTDVQRDHAATRIAAIPAARLASGPGLVTAAFDITRADTGMDLLAPDAPLHLEPGDPPRTVATSARIGISYADEPWRSRHWRLIDAGSRSVSGVRA